MYICLKCGHEFSNPAVHTEKHNLASPPYESIDICPLCHSTDFSAQYPRYCRCCGARLADNRNGFCSFSCEERYKKLKEKEQKRKKLLAEHPLYKLVREIEQFNRRNHRRLSYGQYVALFKAKVNKK